MIKLSGILAILEKMKGKRWTAEELLPFVEEHEYFQSKYATFISKSLHVKMHIANEFDIEVAVEYLNTYEFRIV